MERRIERKCINCSERIHYDAEDGEWWHCMTGEHICEQQDIELITFVAEPEERLSSSTLKSGVSEPR
jgi:hypothetical protein